MSTTEVLQQSALEIIPITEIIISGKNPRKHFNESELKELSESIKAKGVLQPILVRPIGDNYELVCGERRLRASLLAELESIPCFIRELSDYDAFEAMIIENLERKDVHPMEEAEAFKKMLEMGDYTIADIAARIAKSEKFVQQRLKLNALIPTIKTDFYDNILPIGHAIVIARQSEDIQESIFEDYKDSWNADNDGYGKLSSLNDFIDDFLSELGNANFDITDENLVQGVCSCVSCPKRSGANTLLFEDMLENDRCLDLPCFVLKSDTSMLNKAKELINDPKNQYFIDYGSTVNPMIVEHFQEQQIKILKENTDYYLYNKTGYLETKAIIVGGSGTNIFFERSIWIKSGKNENVDSPTNLQIEKIQERAKRNLELDQEKIQKSISERFVNCLTEEDIKKFQIDKDFTTTVVWCLALSRVGMYKIGNFSKILDFDIPDYETFEEYQNFILSLDDDLKMKFALFMVQNEFKYDLPITLGSKFVKKAYEFFPDNEIDEIIAQQDVKAKARIKREQERINDLLPDDEPENKSFKKVSKKYSLNNSYFKNLKKGHPKTISEINMYYIEHKELPFEYSGENWLYDTIIEFQKRNGVQHSQYFTPDLTANRMTEIGLEYFNNEHPVLDACCGFGQLSKGLVEIGFEMDAFDISEEMVTLYNSFYKNEAKLSSISEMKGTYYNIIANPPHEIQALTEFFEKLFECLREMGTAVLLLPKGFVDKTKPKKLLTILDNFIVLHREEMKESFAHTKFVSEIVIVRKK